MYFGYINSKNRLIGVGISLMQTDDFGSDDVQNVEISEDVFNIYKNDPDRYIWNGHEIIENPDYTEIKKQEHERQWLADFFETSLGWVRRKVSIQMTGETRDFLYDIKPTLRAGIPIITYQKPDFETSFDPVQNRNVIVTDQFLAECETQIYRDFYGESPGS